MALTKVTGHVVKPDTNIQFHNTKSTGIVTFTHTSNATSSTTGALQITGGVGIVKDLHVGGNVTVGGTLTYDDVTNIDSLGIITARGGINVSGGNVTITNGLDVDGHTELDNLSVVGVSTFDGGAVDIINGGGAYNTHLNYNDTGINYITSTNGGGTYFRGSNNNVTAMAIQGSGPVDIDGDLRHLGDTDTMLKFGNNTISLLTANVERTRTTEVGRVGIGTTNPVAHLEVAAYQNVEVLRLRDRHFNKYLTIQGGGTPNRMVIDSYEGGGGGAAIDLASNGDTKVRIGSDGKVGIGTDAAGSQLSVGRASGNSGLTLDCYGVNRSRLIFRNSVVRGTQTNIEAHNDDLRLVVNSGNRLNITSAGYVGVGITNPGGLFTVSGDPAEVRIQHAGNSSYSRLISDSSNELKIYTGGGPHLGMTIDGSQRVGIGEGTNVTQKLHIREDNNSQHYIAYLQNRYSGTHSSSLIAMSCGTVDFGDNRYAYMGAKISGVNENGTNLIFGTNPNGGSASERLRIKPDGKIKFATDDSSTDYLEFGNNPRLWLRCPSNMNGLRIDASTTPLQIRSSDATGRTISIGGAPNFDMSISGDYSLSSGQYDSSPTLFFNATRHNGSTTVTTFQTSIKAVATSNTNNTGYLGFGGSASPDDLVILTSGDVGIGTVSPSYRLQVHHPNPGGLLRLLSSHEGNYDLRFVYQNNETNIWSYASSDMTFGTRYAKKLHLVTNGPGKRLTIDDGGYVGIGTVSPQSALHVRGAGGIRIDPLGTMPIIQNENVVNDGAGNPYLSGTPWFTAHTYSYDTNNSPAMDYYWIKIVESLGYSAICYIEYMCHSDSNYPRSVHGRIDVAKYANASLSISHQTITPQTGITPELVVDSNQRVWIRMNGSQWNSDFRYRVIYSESTNVNSDFTIGTDNNSAATGRMLNQDAQPLNASGIIESGANIRWDLSNSNPPKYWSGSNFSTTAGTYGDSAQVYGAGQAKFFKIATRGRVDIKADHQNHALNVHANYIGVNNPAQPTLALFKSQKSPCIEVNRMYTQGILIQFRQNNDARGYIENSGTTTDIVTSGSDIRLKKNFEDWTEEVLPHFKTLKPKKFHFNEESDDDKKTKGYIAQDNLDKFPEAYPLNSEDDRYWFKPGAMVPYLMKALQEEIIKREEIEAKYNALEARISALESDK